MDCCGYPVHVENEWHNVVCQQCGALVRAADAKATESVLRALKG